MKLRTCGLFFGIACFFGSAAAQAQFAQQGPKLVGTDTIPYSASQGYSVALSGDGNTAILGAPYAPGVARVFTRSGAVWTEQPCLGLGGSCQPSPPFEADFGSSVSISADGNTAIIGAPFLNDGIGFAGVYGRTGGVWTLQAGFSAPPSVLFGPYEGASVSLSADGNTAIVGGPSEIEFVPECNCYVGTGGAWVLTRSINGGWNGPGAHLVGTDVNGMIANAWLGVSVALSGDGNTAIVGGTNDPGPAGWVFTRSSDGGWTQQEILVGGSSVALSADGNTAILGNAEGAIVYSRSSTAWNQGTTLPGTGALRGGPFGPAAFSVSLSGDGTTAMVGTSVFTRSEVGWTQQALPAGTGAVGDAAQGFSVALSGDGYTALVGGPDDNGGVGAAWVYSELVFPGTPGVSNCHGQRISAISQQYKGLVAASMALGFASVQDLQNAVAEFCATEETAVGTP